jgi:hypothetical protein
MGTHKRPAKVQEGARGWAGTLLGPTGLAWTYPSPRDGGQWRHLPVLFAQVPIIMKLASRPILPTGLMCVLSRTARSRATPCPLKTVRARPLYHPMGRGAYPRSSRGSPVTQAVARPSSARCALCRERSLASATALCDMAEDPKEDGRVRAVCAQTILTWAFGRPPDYDPREDRPDLAIDTSQLSSEERRFLLAILRKGMVKEVEPEARPSPPPTILGNPV